MTDDETNRQADADRPIPATEQEPIPSPSLSHVNPSTGASIPPSLQHTTPRTLGSDIVESPSEEVGDVLNELIGGHHAASGAESYPPWRPQATRFSSFGSVPEYRMSINPAHGITESLRSLDLHAGSTPIDSQSSSPALISRANTAQSLHDLRMEEAQEQQRQHSGERMEGALPENDGMRDLRLKLQEIRELAISTEEKAQRMHALMARDFLAHKAATASPAGSRENPDRAHTPLSSASAQPVDPANSYNVQPADLEPTYYSPLKISRDDADQDEAMEDEKPQPVLGCMHYMRNVKIQCFDCHLWVPCRHCHDQLPDLPFPHSLVRKKTQNMLCMFCKTPQPAAHQCVKCEQYAAWYYCSKCKLWDNDRNKPIYHCDDCGLCRVGHGIGKDYVHCKRCNVCITIGTSASHPCIERATESDCPLCLVYLFDSNTSVCSLPCGHYMHGACYKDLMAVTYKCPVCSKSAVNMELQWRKLDDEIAAQPIPEADEDLEGLLPPIGGRTEDIEEHHTAGNDIQAEPTLRRPRRVWIGCNDCGSRCWTPFHWLGLKCQNCGGYNTNQMAPTAVCETEAERLIRQQGMQPRQHDFTGNSVLRDAGIGMEESDDRADSAFVPSSPSNMPSLSPSPPDRRASGAQSPGGSRRYFVQEEDRRPSFNAPRFPTPSLPNLPRMPDIPNLPSLPNMPNMPNMPNLPNLPNFQIPRFSPYDMMEAVSRSLSPMRYYMEGLDVRDRELRRRSDSNRSPTSLDERLSVRSDPTPGAGTEQRRAPRTSVDLNEDAIELSGSEDDSVWSGHDDDDNDHGVQAVGDDDDASSSDSAESEDAEMIDDDIEGGNDLEDMELFGHR